MEPDKRLYAEAEALEQQLWQADDRQLALLAAGRASSSAADLSRLLAEVSDEGLARAVQRDFLVGPAFVELFVSRRAPPRPPGCRPVRRRGAARHPPGPWRLLRP